MNEERETPFDSIEGAHQYVSLLEEALLEAQVAIQHDTADAGQTPGAERRVEALHLVSYKLNQLREHLSASRRLLNDLRTLRRLLRGEREETVANPLEARDLGQI